MTFFDPETDELDLEAQKKYYTYLSQHLTGTYNDDNKYTIDPNTVSKLIINN